MKSAANKKSKIALNVDQAASTRSSNGHTETHSELTPPPGRAPLAKPRRKTARPATSPTRLSTGSLRIGGQLLAERDFERQATEAETEPSDELIERLLARQANGQNETRRGRPSLGGAKGTSTHLQIRVDDELNRKIRACAEREGKKVSEIVRDILRQHLTR